MASIEKCVQEIVEQAKENEQMRYYTKTVENLKKMGFDAKPITLQKDYRVVLPNTSQEKVVEQKPLHYFVPSFLY